MSKERQLKQKRVSACPSWEGIMLNIKQALGHFGLNVNIQLICTRVSSYSFTRCFFFFFIHCLCCFSLNYSHSPTMTPRGNHCTVYTSLCLFCFICFAISALMDRIEQLFEIVLLKHGHIHKFLAHKHVIVTNISLLFRQKILS